MLPDLFLMKKKYLRFREPRTVEVNGKPVLFTEWHWLDVTILPSESDSPTKVMVTDCRGHAIEVLHRDLSAWNYRFVLTADFGPLGIHETVDVSDPSTCDGETIVVLAGKSEIKVPVKYLAPWSGRHAHEEACAV